MCTRLPFELVYHYKPDLFQSISRSGWGFEIYISATGLKVIKPEFFEVLHPSDIFLKSLGALSKKLICNQISGLMTTCLNKSQVSKIPKLIRNHWKAGDQ